MSEFQIDFDETRYMQRIERLYAINEILRRRSPALVSAQELATDLGVTRRTIERDLSTLRSAGAPLYGQPGRKGGAGSVQPATRTIVSLSDAELLSLVLAAKLAEGAPFGIMAATAAARLLDTLDDTQRTSVSQLRNRFRMTNKIRTPINTRPAVISTLETAVHAQTIVRIRYTDRNGIQTLRSVDPIGFVHADGEWSLIGWCHLREDGRLFRLARINRADRTKQPCTNRDIDEVLGWMPQPVQTL